MSDTQSIREILHASYERSNWQSLLQDLIPEGSLSLLGTPQDLEVSADQVTETLQLGTITLPGDDEKIALLEITTTDQVKLARNRVGLRNFVANFIDQAQASAVLAVFRQPGSPDWRLTFAARKTTLDQDTFEITTVETAPRRFTFLLGENEACRTAAGRLGLLSDKKDDLSLRDLENAFSVESLSKQFFKKYKEHYLDFVAHLFSDEEADKTRDLFGITEIDDDFATGKANKPVRDFVKTLLGRLVFLTFLQKKGWLGCPANSRQWKGGDSDFLQSFLRLASDENEADLFHSKYLTALFFDALNNDETEHFHLTDSRLPYLNGGLFEDNDDHARSLDFPPQLFHNLLDFFDEYNFTIDENDPEDHEVGIDPEMLGMIFENLLEDNKEKGTYYTPKAIVSYMARQSLLHYLQTHLGESEDLETLLNEKNSDELPPFAAKHRQQIADLLDRVTICDPAIGSGAFPIGLLHEILWTRLTLEPEKNTPEDRAALKRNIIQNSIHGVDIDPGAIEIARLRFWLALVVDEDEPRPLPNLDYKIHRADSLIEYIRGEPVNLGTETPKDEATQKAVGELIAAKQDLFTAQGLPGKRRAWFSLYRALAQLAQAEFTWMRNQEGLFAAGERVAQLDKNAHEFGKWIRQIDAVRKEKVYVQERLLAELRAWFDDEKHPTFLWNLHFGGIFADGGFDIVIANPPYIGEDDNKETFRPIIQGHLADYYRGKMDIFYFFIHLAMSRLLKPKGVAYFITTSYFVTADGAVKLRQEIKKNAVFTELINFGDLRIFQSAKGQHNLLYGLKRESIPNTPVRLASTLRKGESSENHVSRILQRKCTQSVYAKIENCKLFFGKQNYIILATKSNTGSASKTWKTILRKMERCEQLLSASDIAQGLVSGCDKVTNKNISQFKLSANLLRHPIFIFDLNKTLDREVFDSFSDLEKGFLKPFFKNSDIAPYHTREQATKLVLYLDRKLEQLTKLPKIEDHLSQFRSILENRREVQSGRMKWFQLQWPRDTNLFEELSIVVPYRAPKLLAAFTSPPWYCRSDCYLLKPKSSLGAPLLAYLNSKAATYWLGERGKKKGSILELFPTSLKQLPIPPASDSDKARLAALAEKCAEAAAADDQPTLEAHEHEINQIVYRLFDLTAEEIALIESSLKP